MTSDELREVYLRFFERKQHKLLPGAPLVPEGDPTLLFTPAGMNQFKDQFLGRGITVRRAATCQKCLRTDDIDLVGETPYHHTFFEMLGNFSFGDYFKKETILWAWEFVTQVLKLQRDKLLASIHEEDEESANVWLEEIGLPAERLSRFGEDENFWPANAREEGPDGPCGPCSEIFFDAGEKLGCGRPECNVNCTCGRYIEIWNLVFTQFNRTAPGVLEPLPARNVDTGMGLERTAAVLQAVPSNFETDLFMPILSEIAEISGRPYVRESADGPAMRRIADHIRAVAFTVADGVLPSNEGRGYVVRRLLRRAIRSGRHLGLHGDAFLHRLVPVVAHTMEKAYPELRERREHIVRIVAGEEAKFNETLEQSFRLLEEAVQEARSRGENTFSGEAAFKLYDTYGLPLEETELAVRDAGMVLDHKGFEEAMAAQRERARSGTKLVGSIFAGGAVSELKGIAKETKFVGHDKETCRAKLLAIVVDDRLVDSFDRVDGEARLLFDRSPFYGEAGGQVGDTGVAENRQATFHINDTARAGELILHMGRLLSGKARVGRMFRLEVDAERRASISRNHTATHLLHYALRSVLGQHAEQAGSLVAPEKLRFDFPHPTKVQARELEQIERTVNEKIIQNARVRTGITTYLQAKREGAIALFGESYGEQVRVVEIGDFSKELCGGVHVRATGEIGLFKIVSEGSVAAGVRRIEAVTGTYALDRMTETENLVLDLMDELKSPRDRLRERVRELEEQAREARRQLERERKTARSQTQLSVLDKAERIGETTVLCARLEDTSPDELRNTADGILKKAGSAAVVLGTSSPEKRAYVACLLSPDLVRMGLNAGAICRSIGKVLGGGGGGRPEMAQAGGSKVEHLDAALAESETLIKQKLEAGR